MKRLVLILVFILIVSTKGYSMRGSIINIAMVWSDDGKSFFHAKEYSGPEGGSSLTINIYSVGVAKKQTFNPTNSLSDGVSSVERVSADNAKKQIIEINKKLKEFNFSKVKIEEIKGNPQSKFIGNGFSSSNIVHDKNFMDLHKKIGAKREEIVLDKAKEIKVDNIKIKVLDEYRLEFTNQWNKNVIIGLNTFESINEARRFIIHSNKDSSLIFIFNATDNDDSKPFLDGESKKNEYSEDSMYLIIKSDKAGIQKLQ